MTREELLQLRKLKNEIKLLQQQKTEIENRIEKLKIPNTVQASSKSEPFKKHSITIHGIPKSASAAFKIQDKILQNIKRSIITREQKCLKEYHRINTFIDSINDSEMRQILTLYYIQGFNWQQVALKIGRYDESYPRRKHIKFLKNITLPNLPN